MTLSVTDYSLWHLHDIRTAVEKDTAGSAWSRFATPEERLACLNRQFEHLKLEDYLRCYTDRSAQCTLRIPDPEELEAIFLEMNKTDEASRHINCSCCGYDTCMEMATAIHNGFNHKDNCIHYLKDMYVKKAAETDIMTGLPNAAGFRTFINRTCAARTLTTYNAFYLNVMSFGLINKKYGKQEADHIIIRFAKHLQSYADEDEFVGRLSGDTFILMVHKEKTDTILNLTSGVSILAVLNGMEEMTTLQTTAGCLDLEDEEMDSEGIIGRCSTALNIAKNEKHVPYLFSTPEMHSNAIHQKQILSIFADALAKGEFRPYYQPKVNTKTRTIAGAEALVRWIRNGEVIVPGEFIPVLENGNRICMLDFCIFEQVCQDLRRWLDEGIEPVRISTNFSRKNLSNPDFSENIRKILDTYHIPKQYIEVEITETVSEEDNERLRRFMRDMRESSIVLAIDDFGTGYSSLNTLRDFSADILKLDKSFIDGHTDTRRDSVVVANVAKMASELNMSIITEGVENWDQVNFLRSVNINMVQGFLFDKPLPKDEFESRLKKKTYD